MAIEPITIFSRIADPARVVHRLRELDSEAEIDGPDDSWRSATLTFECDEGPVSLTFTHDPDYYAEPNWSAQMDGMRGYFSRFPDTDRKQRVLMLTTTFKISFGTLLDPDFDPESETDPRLSIVCKVAEAIDGVLFSPSALRDANGCILFSAGGKEDEDPDATWPRVAAVISSSDPAGAAMDEISQPNSAAEVDEEAEPPSPERVARRALALTALTGRAILEQDVDGPDTEETYADLLSWVSEIGLDEEFEPHEREVVNCPLGELDQKSQVESTWRIEALIVLAWALQKGEVPSHDQLANFKAAWHKLGILNAEKARETLRNASLRPRSEIEELRKRLFAIHWRLRSYWLEGTAMDFAEFAKTCWFGPLDISLIDLQSGDIAIGGKRIDEADEDLISSCSSTAHERHQAANWLLEGPETFSYASVAT